MSSKYPTIQQHEPLTPPRSWGTEERRLLVRLEEILDDIYRRFGRLRIEDFSPKVRDKISSIESLDDRVTVAEGEISNLGDEIVLKVSKGTYGPGTISEGATAPENPVSGDLWYKTSNDSPPVVMKYNGAIWEVVAAEEVHTSGIDIASDRVEITTENFSIQITDGTTQEQELSVDKEGVYARALSADDISGLPAAMRYVGESFSSGSLGVIAESLNNKQLTEDVTVTITEASLDTALALKGITGPGKLKIVGDPTEIFGGVSVTACMARIEFEEISAQYTVEDSPFVKFTNCSGGSSGTQTVTVTDQVIQAHTTSARATIINTWTGSRSTFWTGPRENGRKYYACSWFDLSGIPEGAKFTDVKLRFYRVPYNGLYTGNRTLYGNTVPYAGPSGSFSTSDVAPTSHYGSGNVNAWTQIDETVYASGIVDKNATTEFCEKLRTGAYCIFRDGSTSFEAVLDGSASDHPPELVVSYEYETGGSDFNVTYVDNGLTDYLRGIGAIT